MFKRLIAFSLDQSLLVIAVAILLLVLAFGSLSRMPVDVFPELNAPTVVVLTECGGYAADEVEQYVTFPIESAVGGLPGVRRVRSSSSMGLSLVWVEFDWGADIYRARQVVSEGLATVLDQLPREVHTEIAPITGITGEIMLLSLTSPEGVWSPQELRAFAEFELFQRLMSVTGVAQVVSIGGELPEYQINALPGLLQVYGLTINDLVEAAGETHSTASAGYLANVQGMELPLRQVARVSSAQDIERTVIKYVDNTPVTIGDVAEVGLGAAPPRGTGATRGFPAVVVGVKKAPFTNTLDITDRIDAVLDDLEPALPAGVELDRFVMRQANFINLSLSNITRVLRDASVLVVIVLILFLANARMTFITVTAIPLSLAAAFLVLEGLGLGINVMIIGGLAIAIGELVDNAIIFVENVNRRLATNATLPQAEQAPKKRIIYRACTEILPSVVFATVIIVLVFVPLLFLEGIEGRFFQPMGIAYIVAVLASLLVALTVVPALCKFLVHGTVNASKRESPLVRWLKGVYEPILRRALRFRVTVLVTAALATVASLGLGATYGSDFLPEFNEGAFTLFIDAPPGTSLPESDRMVQGLDRRLAAIEGVRTVVRRTGRAERDEHAHGVNSSETVLTVDPGFSQVAIRRAIDDIIRDTPGLQISVGAPLGHQLSHVLSGTQAAIAINVFGEDLALLRAIAQEIEVALEDIPGTRDILANREARIASLPIRYRHNDLKRWGFSPAEAAAQVEAAFNGVVVATVNEGMRRYDIVVRLHPEQRVGVDDVKALELVGPDGARVRLAQLADIGMENMPLGIQRENAQRKALISLNVAEGYNIGDLVEEVEQVVTPIVQAHGYSVTYGGQFEAQRSASRMLYITGGFAVLVIFLLLSTAFNSVRAALLVMVNLPLALIGGIIAIFVTESPSVVGNAFALAGMGSYEAPIISIASLVGFVTLFGIASRNGILLVNHYAQLMHNENIPFEHAVIQGSLERLVPILMTALTAILGLIPIAMAKGQPGSELLAPLAIVALGGLVTSTLLNLVVLPAGYHLIFQNKPIEPKTEDEPLASATH